MQIFKKTLAVTALTLGLVISSASQADDRIEHFKGLPSGDYATAIANLTEYNEKLKQVLAGEITDATLVTVHELTYTLENALERLEKDLEEIAEVLEEVHVASETFEHAKVAERGAKYLELVEKLTK